jgi:hypothetical protein
MKGTKTGGQRLVRAEKENEEADCADQQDQAPEVIDRAGAHRLQRAVAGQVLLHGLVERETHGPADAFILVGLGLRRRGHIAARGGAEIAAAEEITEDRQDPCGQGSEA